MAPKMLQIFTCFLRGVMSKRIVWTVLALAVMSGLLPFPVYADRTTGISFSSSSSGGAIGLPLKTGKMQECNATGGALNGCNIPITSVAFGGSPSYGVSGFSCGSGSGADACGLLAFTTGSLISSTSTSYTFNGGGFITITGMVPGGGVTTLLTASFVGPVVVTLVSGKGGIGSIWQLSGAIGINTVDPSVLALFPNLIVEGPGSLNSNFILKFRSASGAFGGTATNQSVFVSAAAVPEPPGLLLFGSGLTLVATILRRWHNKPV